MARQIVSSHTPISSEVDRAVIENHPEYGDALLKLEEENFVVTLYRHPDRSGWLWYIANVEGSSVVGRIDTRQHPHAWLSVDYTLIHLGILPSNTTSLTVTPTPKDKLSEAYSTYSDSEHVYIVVTHTSSPVQIQFADVSGNPFYTIERNISIMPSPEPLRIPWSLKLKLFLMQHGLLPLPPENRPEQQRALQEIADRIWNQYDE